jgi:hypothetical protein
MMSTLYLVELMLLLSDYYTTKLGYRATLAQFRAELSFYLEIEKGKSHGKRSASLDEAKANPIGPSIKQKELYHERKTHANDCTEWTPIFSNFYQKGDLAIGSFKPGKEAASDYTMSSYHSDKRKVPNPHDMFPVMLRKNANIAVKITYSKSKKGISFYTPWTLPHISDIFDFILRKPNGSLALELIGCLLVRMAYMIDHVEDENGKMRLRFPSHTIEQIRRIVPILEFNAGDEVQTFDIEAFLCWFDILAVNEEIKVDGKGLVNLMENGKPTNKGRTNTLLTYAYCIGAMLGRLSVGSFAFGYHRNQGIFPLDEKLLLNTYPLLDPDIFRKSESLSFNDMGWYYPI